MDPGRHELLVHITASSTARDDKRYLAIARSVLEFQPAIITKVSRPISGSSYMVPSKSVGKDDDRHSTSSGHKAPRAPLPRSNTAPELSSIIEADSPLSLQRNHRRAHSDTSSVSKSFSALDGPKVDRPDSEVKSFRDHLDVETHSQPRGGKSVKPLVSANSARKRKKPRMSGVGDEHTNLTDGGQCERKHTDRSSWQSIPERDPFVCREIAIDDDAESTESVSPSHLLGYYQAATTASGSHEPQSQLVVDLITPERRTSCSYPTPTSSPVVVKHFRPVNAPACTHPEALLPFLTNENRIRQRPDEVHPLPKFLAHRSQPSFTTHITTELNRLTTQMKHFRPAFVARDVRVLERGYWQLLVQLVEPSKPKLKLLGSTARRKGTQPEPTRTNHARWTEDEFVKVWENLARVIELGKLGWGTWLVKDSTDDLFWRIRVFTWGETLAHVYLLLFNISNKLTGVISMAWVAASGQVVVQMIPGSNLDGIWERTGPPGSQGVWTFTKG